MACKVNSDVGGKGKHSLCGSSMKTGEYKARCYQEPISCTLAPKSYNAMWGKSI